MVGYRSALWAVAVLGAAAAQAGTPLRGPAAVEALKQQGSYESLRSAHEAARYQVEPGGQAGSWQARNAAQGLEVEFGSDAVRLRHKDGAVRVRWTGFGYGARMQAPAPAAPVALGNRVEYRRGAQREWYVNEGRGFEQGFTLAERPAPGAPGQPLVLTLEMSGDLRPEAIAATGEVRLVAGQTTVLRYEGLKSWDARGRPMPSRMEVEGRQVRLVVEDGQAEYPLTIDPAFTQQVKLTGADGTAGDYFGISVALSGDTALVGASGDDGLKGSAYVFVRSGSGWSQQQKLTASDGATGDLFGRSVALSRDTALVGAAQDDTNKGSAYVFVRNGTVWTEQQKLAASDGTSGDYFGISVALSADTALVGAFGDDTNKGAAYVFVRAGTSWSQQQKLTASAGLAGDYLGNSVALDGDTALVGANSDASGKGAAYVFVRAGTSWSQQQKLASSDIATGDFFGTSVALSGNAALVGSPGGGSAYTFLRGGTAWSQQQKLTASDASIGDQFGAAVALSGNIALIGAVGDDNGKGSAYAFVRGGAFWTEQQKLTAADGVAADFFGHAVALSGNTALAGAYGDDSIKGSAYIIGIAEAKLTASDGVSGDDFGINVALSGDTALVGAVGDDAARGSAYVFVRSGGAWAQQQKLTAADAAVNDWFGGAVALSGDTALIGAVGDDASKGSAYVFTRTGGVWSQQQKLTAADGVANDWFGVSVAVSGDTALIGAYGDDSQKGSAYVFIRSGSTWSLQQKLTAADGVASDWFGAAVALSGETALIGAYGDDSQKGSAYVFLRTGGTWNLQQKLAASDGVITDWFGISVALYGDTALIAALGDDLQRGSAYLFQRTGSTWSQQQKLTASDGVAGDYFGRSVALTGDAALIGADRDDSFAGSAYAFTRNGSTWGDEQKLRAPDGAAGDHFGYSVALGQNAALASAYLDDTSRGSVYVLYPIGTQAPSLVVAKTHIGDFAQGQSNATYTVTVHNASSTLPTSGTVTVTENLPPGLTLVGMAGAPWWNCIGNTCTRGDALAAGATYQPITVTVNVAGNATSPQVNTVTVSGGGSSSATATDATVILGNNPVPAIASLSPGSTNYGGPAFTLTVNGSGFVPGSEARWNGSARPTTYLSASQVQAAIAAADIAASGTALVTVFNPAPVGGLSNAVSFTFTQTGTNKAEITSPAPGSTLPSSVTFQWTAGVNVTAYQLSLSHVPGQAELYNQYLGPAQSVTVTGLACDGLATYVRLWSLIGGAWQFNDYTYTACSGAKGAISSPAPGSTLTSSSQLFQWAAVPGVAAYQLSVSSVAGQAELYNQYVGAALSANATGLPTDGRTLYVRLWSLINGAWQFNDYTYTAASLAATMISPTPGTAFLSATVTFQWAPGTGVAAYQLSISRVAWQAELYNQYLGSALTATATNLPCDGSVLYVRLWSLISGAWQYNNYTYQACSATKAAMTSPTPTTQLAPTTQLFQWSAGSGVSAYQLSISSVFGQAELYNQYLAGALSANVTGLPSDGRTLYVRLWSLIGGAWQFNDYVYNASGGIKAAILSPTPGTQLGSPSALFQWSAGSGVAAYQLSISRVAGQAEVYNQYLGSALSVTATGLPTGGGPLYVRIWSLMSGAWQFNDYIYTAAP